MINQIGRLTAIGVFAIFPARCNFDDGQTVEQAAATELSNRSDCIRCESFADVDTQYKRDWVGVMKRLTAEQINDLNTCGSVQEPVEENYFYDPETGEAQTFEELTRPDDLK